MSLETQKFDSWFIHSLWENWDHVCRFRHSNKIKLLHGNPAYITIKFHLVLALGNCCCGHFCQMPYHLQLNPVQTHTCICDHGSIVLQPVSSQSSHTWSVILSPGFLLAFAGYNSFTIRLISLYMHELANLFVFLSKCRQSKRYWYAADVEQLCIKFIISCPIVCFI